MCPVMHSHYGIQVLHVQTAIIQRTEHHIQLHKLSSGRRLDIKTRRRRCHAIHLL